MAEVTGKFWGREFFSRWVCSEEGPLGEGAGSGSVATIVGQLQLCHLKREVNRKFFSSGPSLLSVSRQCVGKYKVNRVCESVRRSANAPLLRSFYPILVLV